MKKICYYLAIDGKTFRNEEECAVYEENLIIDELKNRGTKFFDNNFSVCETPAQISEAIYIYFPDKESYDIFSTYSEKYFDSAIVDFCGSGLYYYNSNGCCYYSIEKEIEKCKMPWR